MEDKPREMTGEEINKMLNDVIPEHIRNVLDEVSERLRQKEKAKQYYEKNKDNFILIEPGTSEWEILENFIEYKKRKLK